MYGIFTYIWLMFMVNVGKSAIHGSYGTWIFDKLMFMYDSRLIRMAANMNKLLYIVGNVIDSI